MKTTAPTCHCGALLAIEDVGAEGHAPVYRCSCPRCHDRASRGEGDGFVIDVDGYGKTPDEAAADWRSRRDAI